MSLRVKVMKGMGWLMGGRLIGHACSLARNILLARLIGPENLGVAATFVITLSFLEAISTLAVDRLLVQADDGDAERFQRTAQATQFLRGTALGLVLFGLSWSLASLFAAPQALPMYQAIALVPVLRGLFHLDTKRVQRDMRFDLDVKLEVVAQVAMLALVWPLCAWLGDYRAAAGLVLAGTSVQLITSHLLAQRRYGWAWDRAYTGRIVRFGWPLLVNGLLMFLILQGDTFVIGSAKKLLGVPYTHADVGQFAAAAGLAMAIPAVIISIVRPVFLPLMARVQHDREQFAERAELCIQSIGLLAAVIGVATILASQVLVRLLYGADYGLAGTIVPWLFAMQSVRLLRAAPTLAAMARGDTVATMYANLIRVFGFAAVIYAASAHASLWKLAAIGCMAEVVSTAFAFCWAIRRHNLPLARTLWHASAVTAVVFASMIAANAILSIEPVAWLVIGIAIVVGLLVGVGFTLTLRCLRREVLILISTIRENPTLAGSLGVVRKA